MKRNTIQFFVILQFTILFTSCIYDQIPNYFVITNGYEFDVIVETIYKKGDTIHENINNFSPNMREIVKTPKELRLISIQIKTSDNILLVEYTPEYINSLWEMSLKNEMYPYNDWIFTEKGLFLQTYEIARRYEWDKEKILAYYRSDEAVKDLQVFIHKASTDN